MDRGTTTVKEGRMKPTDDLKAEHRAIKTMLEILLESGRKLDAQEKIEPEHLIQMVDFLRLFADKCHHGKEEGLLFPAMEEAGVAGTVGPLEAMLKAHEAGRGFVRAMGAAAQSYRLGAGGGREFAENARNYVSLLTGHIDREDRVLFPLADEVIPERKQRELEDGFAELEERVIGPGKHEELHRLLERLSAAYLKNS
jgi:hemerythrin-like domain-containing protein